MKTQADLYEAAAKVMRMCYGTQVNWWDCIKVYGEIKSLPPVFDANPEKYKFALAIVEGRPVFAGDEIYHSKRGKLKIVSASKSGALQWMESKLLGDPIEYWSWNPPKPKTVMVEMLREDAEMIADAWDASPKSELAVKIVAALRKAL
jgi:hypothetical protein